MNKKLISSLIAVSLFSLANGQVFELDNNNSNNVYLKNKNTNTQILNSSEDEDLIIDKTSEEIIIPAHIVPEVDKWMGIVQAKDRDYVLIESTLQSGQNANQGIFDGSSMLHLGAWQNDEKLFKLGLQYGGILSNTNKNGETALHWAAYSNNPSIITMALADKSSLKIINKQNKMGRTPLHFNALLWGNIDVAKALIAQKADLNIADINGQTPLHYALSLRKWDLVKLYIDSGANVSLKDKNGDGIDEYVMKNGDLTGFTLLFKYLNKENQDIIRARLAGTNLNL